MTTEKALFHSPKSHPCFRFVLLLFPLFFQSVRQSIGNGSRWVISIICKCAVLGVHKEVMPSAPKHESGHAKQ
jgi:hypothetical protein